MVGTDYLVYDKGPSTAKAAVGKDLGQILWMGISPRNHGRVASHYRTQG